MLMTLNLQQRTVMGICASLSVLFCLTFLYAGWQWHSDWVLAHQNLAASSIAKTDETANLITAIPSAHLFGKAFGEGDMPISSLQLSVTGILKVEGSDSSASKASISVEGQPSKIFQMGDKLPDGVKIYDIMDEAVVLENNGHLEKLPLARAPLQFKAREEMFP
jgi:hypothetical protein